MRTLLLKSKCLQFAKNIFRSQSRRCFPSPSWAPKALLCLICKTKSSTCTLTEEICNLSWKTALWFWIIRAHFILGIGLEISLLSALIRPFQPRTSSLVRTTKGNGQWMDPNTTKPSKDHQYSCDETNNTVM